MRRISNPLCMLFAALFVATACMTPIVRAQKPKMVSWQQANFAGGVAAVIKLAQDAKNGDNQQLGAAVLGICLLAFTGQDLFPVTIRVSNTSQRTLFARPGDYRLLEQRNGQSYPLQFFIVDRNGRLKLSDSVALRPGASTEILGFAIAPKAFRPRLMQH